MSRYIAAALVTALVLNGSLRAEGKDASAVLDKAIKALGGEEKLGKIKAASWKSKGTLVIMGNESPLSLQTTMQGLDHIRQDFEAEFNGMAIKGATVLAGEKGWRKLGENGSELDKDALASQKRGTYLTVVPVTILPLKGKEFKTELAGEEKVGDKQAVVVKCVGPDGKDFTISFDKESGLPIKQVAKVTGPMGEEFTQETSYGEYKEMGGIKKATKVSAKRDGEKFQDLAISDFKVLDKVDPKTFTEPE